MIAGTFAQDNHIDTIRADAPVLADFGPYSIGVTTMTFVHQGQLDIVGAKPGQAIPRYDRPLTCEIWYPAVRQDSTTGQSATGEYKNVATRDPSIKVTLFGRAIRDAAPDKSGGPYPLVIISHGYPGNRFLLSPFGENLASKGYIVVSIDHTDSTYSDQGNFVSTLYNRSFDQLFVLDSMAQLNTDDRGTGLAGLILADRTALLGYSMGAYGVVNTLGGGLSEKIVNTPTFSPGRILEKREAGNPDYIASMDPRIKAGIAIAPWGMNYGFWDAEGLKGIKAPILFMAGSKDTVAGYSPGSHTIFDMAVNADRYFLTFENSGHNAAAPMPAPKEYRTKGSPGAKFASHYLESVWDTVRMNNIAEHFITAFLAKYIRNDPSADSWLALIEDGAAGKWSMDANGQPKADHTYWKGFGNGQAVGLRLEHRLP
jgi:predicted dienelactone hydrolase